MNALNHAQWGYVADAYTPLLVIAYVLLLISRSARQPGFSATRSMRACVVAVVLAYAGMFVDQWLLIWPFFNLDYSTHTALALVWVMAIATLGRCSGIAASISLLLYCGVMWFQRYHSVMDMLSTGLFLLPLNYWIFRRLG